MDRATSALRAYRKAIDELSRAWRDPHHDCCGRCRHISYMALLEGDTEDLRLARGLCEEHAATGEDYGMPTCDLDGCVLHEPLPFPVARRLLRLYKVAIGGADSRGRKTETLSLDEDACDRPERVGNDAFATLFVRFTRRTAVAHLWITPPAANAPGAELLENIGLGWDRQFLICRDWALSKYREVVDLARADLELEPAKKWELRAPFAKRRPRRGPA